MEEIRGPKFNQFLEGNRSAIIALLRSRYSGLSNDDIEDVYQESSIALYQNIAANKFTDYSGSLRSYFVRICINQSLKALGKKEKMPMVDIDHAVVTSKESVSLSNIQNVLNLSSEDEDHKVTERKERLVQSILKEMTDKCRQLLWGHYADGLKWSVIAGMYNLANDKSAKTTANRCRDSFKEKYLELKEKIYG